MSETGIPLSMVGHDGNTIISRARSALIDNGHAHLVGPFLTEANAGDYDHLRETCIRWFDCDGSPESIEDQ